MPTPDRPAASQPVVLPSPGFIQEPMPPMGTEAQAVSRFLQKVYPDDIPEGLALVVPQFAPTFVCKAHTDLVSAAIDIAARSRTVNVYVGLGLFDASIDVSRSKGTAAEVRAIPGLRLDIDLQTGFHGAANNPPDAQAALALVQRILPETWKLSLVVDSGGGLHIHILFRELWVFDDEDEQSRAERLLSRFHNYVAREFAAAGWNLDNMSNLDRVLRPAPSFNHGKPKHAYSPPRRVRVIAELCSDFRVDPSEVEEFLERMQEPEVEASVQSAGVTAHRLSDSEKGKVKKALAVIPAEDRDVWVKVGFALKRCGDEAFGRQAWDEWSQKSTKYDPENQAKTWASLTPATSREVTLASVYRLAREHGRAPGVPVAAPGTPAGMMKPTSKPPSSADKNGPPPNIERFKPFPTDALPKLLGDYVVQAAVSIGCDPSYIIVPMLAVLAAAIGNTRRLKLKDDWCEPSVIWAAIIGNSGTLKSPALDAALRFVRDLQERCMREYEIAMVEYGPKHEVYKKDYARWKKSTKDTGPPPEKPREPVLSRVLCSDTTVEALAVILQAQPRGLLQFRDELAGWIRSFDQYKDGHGADASKWLEMFGAGSIIVDRKGGPLIHVVRAAVSVVGGIQPTILRSCFSGEHRENGLAPRFLLAAPPAEPKVWKETTVSSDLVDRVRRAIDVLYALTFDPDSLDKAPVDLPFSKEAKKLWQRFYDEHNAEGVGLTGHHASIWAKLEGYAARIALVLHMFRWAADEDSKLSPHEVDAESLRSAIEIVRWFGVESRRVYAILSEDEQITLIRPLVELIDRKGGSTTVREWQRARSFKTAAEAKAELTRLKEAKVGKFELPAPGPKGGRPTEMFRLTLWDVETGVPGDSGDMSVAVPHQAISPGTPVGQRAVGTQLMPRQPGPPFVLSNDKTPHSEAQSGVLSPSVPGIQERSSTPGTSAANGTLPTTDKTQSPGSRPGVLSPPPQPTDEFSTEVENGLDSQVTDSDDPQGKSTRVFTHQSKQCEPRPENGQGEGVL